MAFGVRGKVKNLYSLGSLATLAFNSNSGLFSKKFGLPPSSMHAIFVSLGNNNSFGSNDTPFISSVEITPSIP